MTRLFAFLTLAFLAITPAYATTNSSADIAKVEQYLNGIKTLKARFIQTANDGQQIAGHFMLKRPGRLRFEYDPPVTDFIVADGLLVYYYDGQLKEQSSVPISNSLADFFLRPKLKLSGDLTVSGIKREGGFLQVTLQQTKEPLEGSLTLAFSEEPFSLRRWRIVDAQGAITEIELFDTQTGITLENSLFKYYDPEHTKTRYNK